MACSLCSAGSDRSLFHLSLLSLTVFFHTPHSSFAKTIELRLFRTAGDVQEVPRSGKVAEGLAHELGAID